MNTLISFSGGRTSAMMLKTMIDHYGGCLPEHVKVCFTNTGKEHPATLEFVRDCANFFHCEITWLEWHPAEKNDNRWKTVDFQTASRNGEPFAALVKHRRYLPNPVTRFCTQELKIHPMTCYARQVLGWDTWQVAIGFRADEPRRMAKLRQQKAGFERFAPLAEMGITKEDVATFWRHQPFDLRLPNLNGTTAHGNCDLCFLKGIRKRAALIAENPQSADWWSEQEHLIGATFCKNLPDYQTLKIIAISQQDLFDQDDRQDCFCTD
ncbi:MAG: phosphoadenosine phosphosulfate reductase family protein [Neisseria sp.]|uniref:phosphoadenosine phosphosulfate reductase family protein n=1 Tax=Neisseria sp. TaxID=192066 RepID=UPI0026DADA3C|nr:phosphoadenosine phosphosulfate reductase family protein [Neisseria sp.]MDO4641703.1 phosphoadenosine phosphosulfate reductase family protein [Neisseria sp.]